MKNKIGESSENTNTDESGKSFLELIKKLVAAENDGRAGKSRPFREAMADIRCACRRLRIKH